MLFENIGRALWVLAGAFLLFAAFLVILNVLGRRFLHMGISWTVEISEYLQFGIAYAGVLWCLKIGGHVSIEFIYMKLKPRIQVFVDMITSAAGTMACLVFAWYAGWVTWDSIQRGTSLFQILRVPKYIFTSIMCVCILLVAIQFARMTYKYFKMQMASKNKETRVNT
jgi:TRAP-type C4-dicarboxylate transport system permease small subunit